jgi:hypothetical protein
MKQSIILMRAKRKRQEESGAQESNGRSMSMFHCGRCDITIAYPDNSERCEICGGFTLRPSR